MVPLATVAGVAFGVVLLLAAVYFAVTAFRETGTERIQSLAVGLIGLGLGFDQLGLGKGLLAVSAVGIIGWLGASMIGRDRARAAKGSAPAERPGADAGPGTRTGGKGPGAPAGRRPKRRGSRR